MNGKVTLVGGTLGGGKTLYGAEQAYYHLRSGGHVYTNVKIHVEKVRERMLREGFVFDESRLHMLSDVSVRGFEEQIQRGTAESQVMVLLDEAHLEWNSRDYQSTRKDDGSKRMLNFVTLARKLDVHLIFVTQDPVDIDKQVRRKASEMVMCRNMRNYRIFGLFRFPFNIFSRVFKDCSVGHKEPVHMYSDLFFAGSKKWVFPLYDSDALLGQSARDFEGLAVADSSPLQRVRDERRGPSFLVEMLLGLALCSIFSVWL